MRTPSARAHRRDLLHGRVVVRREQEREARGREAVAGARSSSGSGSPSASSTSALPERLEIERLPCFTTRTPIAATSSAAPGREIEAARGVAAGADDVDRRRARRQAPDGARARASRAAKPRTSSAVTPLARSAASSAPAIAGATRRIGQRDQQLARLGLGQVPPLSSRSRMSRRSAMPIAPQAARRAPREAQEVAHQRRPVRRQHALRDGTARPRPSSSRWRTPMISPSAVRAVTSSTAGSVSGFAISE